MDMRGIPAQLSHGTQSCDKLVNSNFSSQWVNEFKLAVVQAGLTTRELKSTFLFFPILFFFISIGDFYLCEKRFFYTG